MNVFETDRLILRRLCLEDAEFIVELLNDPSFLRFIGDKRVRTLEDARQYIRSGPMDSYELHGFGLWLVEIKGSPTAAGMCGLLKRDYLDDVDLGFAFLPRYRLMGYGFEAAAAVMDYSRSVLGLKRVVAIADQDNIGSLLVLEKIGMSFDRMIMLPDGTEVRLFSVTAAVES